MPQIIGCPLESKGISYADFDESRAWYCIFQFRVRNDALVSRLQLKNQFARNPCAAHGDHDKQANNLAAPSFGSTKNQYNEYRERYPRRHKYFESTIVIVLVYNEVGGCCTHCKECQSKWKSAPPLCNTQQDECCRGAE